MTRQQIEESIEFIRSTTDIVPEGLLILGTGLKDAIGELDEAAIIPYSHIPHFPTPTVSSHEGELVIGRIEGYPLTVMRGRPHFYEGYTMDEITYPVRVVRELGARMLVVTNAAGALNINFKIGDIVIISDHINLMGVNPLRGFSDDAKGQRFPSLSQAYNPELMNSFTAAALAEKILPKTGIYVAVAGPSLETPAELRFFHSAGGDLVGMSTVPEVITGVQLGMRILAVSVVSNMAIFLPQPSNGDTLEEITKAASETAQKMRKVFKRFFKEFSK
ncbi:purine-nucleoside phosphorylase [bacterium]|nr:purine-nucleoside phosphorylase [bacterium]